MNNKFIRSIAFTLALMTLLLLLPACGDTPSEETTPTAETTVSVQSVAEETTAEETVKYDEYGREWVDDGIAETVDLNKRVFTVHTRGGVEQYEWKADELNGETLNDAIYKRNKNVESRLNIELNIVAVGTHADYRTNLETVKQSIKAGDGTYDLLCGYSTPASTLATTGLIWNLNKIEAIDFDKPWWSENVNEALSIEDIRFFGAGSLSIAMIYSLFCIFVNMDILESTDKGYNIYDKVNSGEWTFDEMMRLSENAFVDTNNNGTADAGDVIGFTGPSVTGIVDGLFFATGAHVITKDSDGVPVLEINVEQIGDYTTKIYELMSSKSVYTPGGILDFENGNILFFERWLYWGQTVYGKVMDNYGIVPMPKYNTEQENYATLVQGGMHIYAIPIDAKDPQDVGTITEALAAESYRTLVPAYYEVVLKTRYSKDAASSQMIDIIYDTATVDMAYTYNDSITYYGATIRASGGSGNKFATIHKQMIKTGQKNLTSLIEGMRAAAKASEPN